MTLDDFRKEVAAEIGLDNSDGSQEQGFVDGWINRGIQKFLEETKARVESADITLTAGTGDYELPSAALDIEQIIVTTSDGQVVPLAPISPEELLWSRRYAGSVPVRAYATQGANMLMLYPTPTSPDTMTIYYVPLPATLDNTVRATDISTLTGIPVVFHETIMLYVLYRAARYRDDSSSQNGMTYFQQWTAEVKKARGKIRRIGGRKRPPARAGRKDRLKYYPAFPSQDVGS